MISGKDKNLRIIVGGGWRVLKSSLRNEPPPPLIRQNQSDYPTVAENAFGSLERKGRWNSRCWDEKPQMPHRKVTSKVTSAHTAILLWAWNWQFGTPSTCAVHHHYWDTHVH